MDITFQYYTIAKLLIFLAIVYGFGSYFFRYWKEHQTLPKKQLPYLLLVLIIVAYVFGFVRFGSYEQKERTIKSYDSPVSTEKLEIKPIVRQKYEPDLSTEK